MRIVHVIASLAEASGGPPRSVTALCEDLAQLGCEVDIVTLDTQRWLGPSVAVCSAQVRVHRARCFASHRLRLTIPFGFRDLLRRITTGADVIHSHGVWLPVNRAAYRRAHSARVPHVVSCRGNLHPATLRRSAWKKRIARRLFVDKALRTAACLHATSDEEAAHLREQGFGTPVMVLPTGIRLPQHDAAALERRFAERWPGLVTRRIAAFLGRIHPHKGVFELAHAWTATSPRAPGWHLVIAGPDEIGCRRELEGLFREAGLSARVSFTGPVSGDDKWALLRHAELFVLPTHSESFGLSIAEALSVGVPVLTTDATPWQDIESSGCGWRIPAGREALMAKLGEVLALSEDAFAPMRRAAAELIRVRYDSSAVAQEMLAGYEWVAGRGPEPANLWRRER